MESTSQFFLIFDDHPMLRDGVKRWLSENSSWQCAGEASSFEEAVFVFNEVASSIVPSGGGLVPGSGVAPDGSPCFLAAIVDASFKDKGEEGQANTRGFEIIRYIKASDHPCPCIVYSSFDWGGFVEYAMSNEIGADAYVTKNADSSVLITALNEVSHGRKFIQGDIIDRFLMTRQAINALTHTEQQMMDMACEGKSNAEIAEALGKSVRTVENYMGRINDKFGVTTRAELLQLRGRE
ncbi:MAG: response regulator transcription factor [Treponema sp.]|nr:response regulator transcription factor [Treponema sp.]